MLSALLPERGRYKYILFHRQASYRKKKNYISELKVGDEVVSSEENKHSALYDFYNNLLGTAQQRDSTLNLPVFHRPGVNLSPLDEPISDAEVWATIVDIPSDRAPGPDGYTGRFYKACWSIIKPDIMAAILSLQQGNARKLWLLNSAYLSLIPKKVDAACAGDYRPISLVPSFAKLVTKVLANRLAPHLDSLVSSNQNAWVDAFLTIFYWNNKQSNCCTRRKSPGSSSNWIFRRHLIRFPGLSSWKL